MCANECREGEEHSQVGDMMVLMANKGDALRSEPACKHIN